MEEGGESANPGLADGDDRFTPLGDEAGTATGDRRWRPDIEGLRAVAVTVVVAFHYGIPGFHGGYVGVDVFFVISGFVITGLLIREHDSTGKTSLVDFYARRFRRILPAATLVILSTVLASYVFSGSTYGADAARNGIWAAAFIYNFHHFVFDWDYVPSLNNFWSLAVEEQFYFVYPALFLAATASTRRNSPRVRLAVGLVVVVGLSLGFSIWQSSTDPGWAYLSPLTRAWELALGGLIAVGTHSLKRIPPPVAIAMTWFGFAAICVSVVTFPAIAGDYPGWRAVLPVIGTALIIAGGLAASSWGVERVLGTRPFRWLGKRSYSVYLWHSPVFIVIASSTGTKSQWGLRTSSLIVTAFLAVVTYKFVEDPLRHLRLPSRQTVHIGLGITVTTVTALAVAVALTK